jgi:hypothetical protein
MVLSYNHVKWFFGFVGDVGITIFDAQIERVVDVADDLVQRC